jgi:hypothetical protein
MTHPSCPVDLDPVIAEQINRAIKLVDRNGTGVVSYTGLSAPSCHSSLTVC